MTLLEALHWFPGGIKELLAQTKLSRATMYRVARGWHYQVPKQALTRIQVAYAVLGPWDRRRIRLAAGWRPWIYKELEEAWLRT
ncbi:MAG: hypothetical protein ACE5F1_01515 [Planctomycetota bacterium]